MIELDKFEHPASMTFWAKDAVGGIKVPGSRLSSPIQLINPSRLVGHIRNFRL